MSRRTIIPAHLLVAALLVPGISGAAILPDTVGSFHRVSVKAVSPTSDQPIWDEYGLQESEQASYESPEAKFAATAYRFQDSTGAMAAFEWMRPADAKPSTLAKLAVETPALTLVARGNYILKFTGYHPSGPLLTAIVENLKQVDNAPLPAFTDYLPAQDLVPNSERYVLGPAGLAKFLPGIPPSTAAFHMGAEAQLGTFHEAGGDQTLAIFNYPTPQIARQQSEQFQKIPGAIVKRSGPLVAVIPSPPNADAAERLLSLVRYQAAVTLDQRVSTRRDNIGNLVINAFILIGILLAFSLVGGLAFGGFRAFLRRGGRGDEADAMIVLHLGDTETTARGQ
ncbi:MAG: DUF6599 family protein [Bryobacteraceae bacterium]